MVNLNLEIISPSGVIFEGECHMAVIPSAEGEIGAMHGYENLIAALKPGQISIYSDEKTITKTIDVTSGFAEMRSVDKLLVLLD